jgi:hypothetical protein
MEQTKKKISIKLFKQPQDNESNSQSPTDEQNEDIKEISLVDSVVDSAEKKVKEKKIKEKKPPKKQQLDEQLISTLINAKFNELMGQMKTELMDDLVAKIESNNTNITQKFEEMINKLSLNMPIKLNAIEKAQETQEKPQETQEKPQVKPTEKLKPINNLENLLKEYNNIEIKAKEPGPIEVELCIDPETFFKKIYLFNTEKATKFAEKLESINFNIENINLIDSVLSANINRNNRIIYNLSDALENIIEENLEGHFLFINDITFVEKSLITNIKYSIPLINTTTITHYTPVSNRVNIGTNPENFDVEYYYETNPDIQKLNKATLFKQWKNNGLKKNNIGKPLAFDFTNENNVYNSFSLYLNVNRATQLNTIIKQHLSYNPKKLINLNRIFTDFKTKEKFIVPYLFLSDDTVDYKYINQNKYA